MSSGPALPTTSRVTLRSATRDDLEAYVRLETDPEVRRYIGGPSSEATVAARRASTPTPRWGRYVVASTETDQLIGTLFLKRDRDELEVGYLFLPSTGQRSGIRSPRNAPPSGERDLHRQRDHRGDADG